MQGWSFSRLQYFFYPWAKLWADKGFCSLVEVGLQGGFDGGSESHFGFDGIRQREELGFTLERMGRGAQFPFLGLVFHLTEAHRVFLETPKWWKPISTANQQGVFFFTELIIFRIYYFKNEQLNK